MGRMARVLGGGLLGALAMFAWASFAHMATPLDNVGIATLPDEVAVRGMLHRALGGQGGLYQFPSKATLDAASSPAAKAALAQGPYGLLLYQPPGPRAAGLEGAQISGEFVFELIESLIAAILLAQTRLIRYASRVTFVAGIGLAAVLTTNASYWVFYGFPGDYTLGYAFTDLVRYLLAGLAMAAVIRPERAMGGA